MSTTFSTKKPPGPRLVLPFVATFGAVFLLVLTTATIVTFILPEAYESRARIALQRDATAISGPLGQPPIAVLDQNYLQTECGIIRSEVILDPVIDRLNLNEVWQKKYNYDGKLKTSDSRAALRRTVEAKPVPGTGLIDITVSSDDKDEAAKIANAVAEAYKDYDAAKAKARMSQLVDEVKQELAAEGQKPDGQSEEERITEIVTRISKRTEAEGLRQVVIVDSAEPSTRPVRPNKLLNIFLGALIGAVVGILAGVVAASVSWAARPQKGVAIIL